MKYKILENRSLDELIREYKEFAKNCIIINHAYKYYPEISLYVVEIKYVERDIWR